MAIKPILFNTEMVRATLDRRKTCTRRLVKTRKKDACGFYVTKKADGTFSGIYEYDENESMFDNPLMPPYQPGDILYVRETYASWYLPHGENIYCYRATEPNGNRRPTSPEYDCEWEVKPWKPSIHMPKKAARIWLKVTDVRVERLQEITGQDVLKEGLNSHVHPKASYFDMNQREMFENLWNSTIKKSDLDRYGWDANPWVWVIEFERCEKPEGV